LALHDSKIDFGIFAKYIINANAVPNSTTVKKYELRKNANNAKSMNGIPSKIASDITLPGSTRICDKAIYFSKFCLSLSLGFILNIFPAKFVAFSYLVDKKTLFSSRNLLYAIE
jgi:hypothetical protein